MRPISVSVGPLVAASTNNIALSQTQTVAGALILNGTLGTGTSLTATGVATIAKPQNIKIHSNGDDHLLIWTITGTNWAGNIITELLTGANAGDATSLLDYVTITSIVSSVAAASAVLVGTTGVGGSQWVRFDEWAEAEVGMQFTVSGTVSYTFQGSFDDPNSLINPVSPYLMSWDSTISPVVGASTSLSANLAAAPIWGRVILNSGTGSVRATMTQYLQVPTT